MAVWLAVIVGVVVAIAIPLVGAWYARSRKPED
jgi:hypothetical protein